jgi:catechol 2,3-dioxygenase-like lactoylglutathione lyase family enzyme
VHHVGFLVDDLAEGVQHFVTTLGFRIESDVLEDCLQTARAQFLRQSGERHRLELISPLGEDSKLNGALQRGAALYHRCYEIKRMG